MINQIINKVRNSYKYRSSYNQIKIYEAIDGYLNKDEAVALFQIASSLPLEAKIVEIGSWKGKSTYCLAKGLKSGKIYAIDPFDATGEVGSKEIYVKDKGNADL